MARSAALQRKAVHHNALAVRKGAVIPIRSRIPRISPEANLERFDEHDFKGFNMQDWDVYRKIHAPDVVVTFPDGRKDVGIEEHIKGLQAMFAAIPDFRVTEHTVRIGSGDWTAVTETVIGTFSGGPMIRPDGVTIQPTGRSFKLRMCAFARWNEGRIVEELLFWDNADFKKQLGIEG